jgi:predicted DNA-binding protein with PD1-like motif
MSKLFKNLTDYLRSTYLNPNKLKTNILLLLFVITVNSFLISCKSNSSMPNISSYAIRLLPGQDLKESIQKLVVQKNIKAGWISTCAGSLTQYNIRFANQPDSSSNTGHFEIVSLTGTVSINGSHLHISISDSTGKTIGGHLIEGSKIYTTAEIVLLATDQYEFKREKDGTTPWDELQIIGK